MKKFLIKVVAFLLVVGVLAVGINAVYMKLDTSDDDYTRKFAGIEEGIEICNVGSSHGLFGFNYDDLEETTFNFALVSQYPSYDLRLLYAYQDYLAPGCVVFIQSSYFTIIGIGEEEYSDFESKNKRYYKILPDEFVKEYDAKTDFIVSRMPSLDARADLVRALLGNLKYDGHPNMDKTTTAEKAAYEAPAAYERHLIENKVDESGKHILNQPEIDAIYDIIELCQEKGWNPVLVTVPYLHDYTDAIMKSDSDYIEWYNGVMEGIASDTGAPYYDYAFDERFEDRYDFYVDVDHMNREGAKLFTNILYEEVVANL